jgi:hypothetical protein
MSLNKQVRRIAIVGTGVIGASWAAQYLARGFDVIAANPDPKAELELRKNIDAAWKELTIIGLSPGATRDRLTFTSNMKEALSKADFVQENAPERPDFKIKLFTEIDDATPTDSIIASSSSGITMSVIQSGCKHPERCVIGHPFNPPHMIPLVEVVGAEAGLPFAMLRTTEEFMKEIQYTEVLSKESLIKVEKIGESDPVPFRSGGKTPLDGVRALGMGHVIAGAGIGRDLALFGADVLNIWQPLDWEWELFYWTSHVGMRSSILDFHEQADLKTFNDLLNDADVFFSNRRPGYQERYGLTAEELCSRRPGLIHAKITLHGETGPWSNRTGFDEVAGAVTGVFALEGTPNNPRLPPIHVVCDYIVAWLTTVGIMSALRRRAVEGGSYRVVVSLTRVTLWLLSLGIFDKKYAHATAGSSDEHTYVAPDLFTADTPLGLYQGVTEQVVMSRTHGSFRTVLVPRGSSKAEWES